MTDHVKYACVILGVWLAGAIFAVAISDHEIIEPEKGVHCIIVSRAFNTSVACWKIGGTQPPPCEYDTYNCRVLIARTELPRFSGSRRV